MRQRYLWTSGFVLGGLGVFAGCGAPKASKPTMDLPEEKLIMVVGEMELALARQVYIHDMPATARDAILHYHKIDAALFNAWMQYYADHPKEYVSFREKVTQHLQRDQMRYGQDTTPSSAIPPAATLQRP